RIIPPSRLPWHRRCHDGCRSPDCVTKEFTMLTRLRHLPVLVMAYALVCAAASPATAQTSLAELQKLLQEKSAYQETDFTALQRGETVVRPAPAQDKREVAVSGLVTLRANADEFLRTYRDGLTQKSNAAVLEIGTFGAVP